MEHFPISVTLLANAGVCIGYRGMTLLLDGIFGREGNPFSPLPADCRQKMCRGEPPFESWTACCSPTFTRIIFLRS